MRHFFEPSHDVGPERAELRDLRPVARLAQPCHRLPHFADRSPVEAEPVAVDDRLVAHVERAQAGLLEERAPLGADSERGEPQPVFARERDDDGEERLDAARLADRVARDHEHAVFDAVGDERGPLGIEEVVLVRAQLEERERVRSVLAHEPRGGAPELGVRQVPGSGERPEEEVRADQQRDQTCELNREPRSHQLVVGERERGALPEEEVARPAQDVDG